eukprot:PhF_6_TR4712/c0_g1_i1/m.6528/K00655/plsC; 1-acyl-sn-glycerol-3-phosphate acyltransferase
MFFAVYSVIFYLVMLLVWVVAWTVSFPLYLIMLPFASKYTRITVCGYVFRTFNVFLVRVLNRPLWSMTTFRSDLPKEGIPKKCLFMVNHASNSDPWLAACALWPLECKWIAKGSLFNVPFGGWCMGMSGDVKVQFTKEKGGWGTKKGSVGKMMEYCSDLVNHGIPLAIFPEGVRRRDPVGPLQPFKPGFFDFSIKEQCVIIPVVLTNTHDAWHPGDWKVGPANIYVNIGTPIYPEAKEVSPEAVEALSAKVYKIMSDMKDATPGGIVLPRESKQEKKQE